MANTRSSTTRVKLIQRGDSTQIQGQEITFNSFRAIKSIVSNPEKPIPLEVVVTVVLSISFSL